MSEIKNFEQACDKLGIDSKVLPDVSMLLEKDQKPILALYKLTKIVEINLCHTQKKTGIMRFIQNQTIQDML